MFEARISRSKGYDSTQCEIGHCPRCGTPGVTPWILHHKCSMAGFDRLKKELAVQRGEVDG